MGSRNQTSTSTERAMAAEAARGGFSSVGNIAVRVAGMVPTRVDMRFAGTPQQQLGISLGTILAYMSTHLTAQAIADKWAAAAPMARGLSQVLPVGRHGAMASGPWLLSAMVRFAGMPTVNADVLTAQPGRELPTMLRIQVGPVTWELADAAAYSSMLSAWRIAADLLAAPCGDNPPV
ncbi:MULTISPECIES: hypothetical protein [Pseudonocardia]|uniref:Uncharacterized protein n=2 Tax=Pseudonocardia TaxID=1847 RepID=A0A1Y2MHY2_PSEAH|nr:MULTISPECIES: hypothetical protein [Pseudonocardia]OSY34884.1 hypothetical protein BG845_06454 [Pseudonocardia autotrophica]TDN75408.1 hypothetical protein C8E95_4565 [Pseudonocardia autotrophica]BBF99364.1 hypothetical protein Pdca_05740 [Pseudonocardia autotrophica]GEC29606.1 hypothetical protein PSA01_66350 [Pseudonocardia saturnea]